MIVIRYRVGKEVYRARLGEANPEEKDLSTYVFYDGKTFRISSGFPIGKDLKLKNTVRAFATLEELLLSDAEINTIIYALARELENKRNMSEILVGISQYFPKIYQRYMQEIFFGAGEIPTGIDESVRDFARLLIAYAQNPGGILEVEIVGRSPYQFLGKYARKFKAS